MSTAIEADDLLRIVAGQLEVDTAGLSKAQLLVAIERGLHAVARSGRRTLLVVDEAQALPISALEELRMLSNFQAGGRGPDDPAFDPARLAVPPRLVAPLGLAAAAVVLLAASVPAWSAVVAREATPLPSHIDLPRVTGWTRVPLDTVAPWQPYYPGADHLLVGRYSDGRDAVEIAIAASADQREGRELVAFGTGVLREEDRWVRIADLPPIDHGTAMRITAPGPVERIVATWYRVGGTMATSGVGVKLATIRARLGGNDRAAVALHLSTRGQDSAAITRFLAAAGSPDQVMTAAIGRR